MESTSLSIDDINTKIKQKLEQLSGLVSEDGAAHIVANELGVELVPSADHALEIDNLLEGLRNVEVTVKVTKKFDSKEFNTARGPGKVASFMIADKSGRIRATLWNAKVDEYYDKFNEGDIITIKNGYVRKNNYSGNLDLNLGDGSDIIINPKGITIEVQDTNVATRKKINEITSNDFMVEVLATIVQVSDIRFWEVCPECNRKPKFENETYTCKDHGEISKEKLTYSYVLNCYLDDGTASIRTVFWKKQIQDLLGEAHEKIITYRESPDLFEPFKSSLLGEVVKISGRINNNQAFDRMELVADTIIKNPNPEEEVKELKVPEKKEEPKPVKKEEAKPVKKEEGSDTKSEEIPSLSDIEEINIDDE